MINFAVNFLKNNKKSKIHKKSIVVRTWLQNSLLRKNVNAVQNYFDWSIYAPPEGQLYFTTKILR